MNSLLNPNAVPFQPTQVVAVPVQQPTYFPRFRRRPQNFSGGQGFRRQQNQNQGRGNQNQNQPRQSGRRNNQNNRGSNSNQRSMGNLPFEQHLLMMANEATLSESYPSELQGMAPTKLVKIAKRAALQIVSGHATVEIADGENSSRVANFTIKVALR